MNLVDCPSHPLLKYEFPTVFSGMTEQWPASKWTPDTLSQCLGDFELKFRVGAKESCDIVWEGDCQYKDATIGQYSDWISGEGKEPNPLCEFARDSSWCYASYTHMGLEFCDFPELLKGVDWSVFGFKGRAGHESTFWMGSEGAYTPCHYDAYGCNLVAQIYGRKRWILFPPTDTNNLYPTRLPYEESSIYSQVNIRNPDLRKHPKFAQCHPYIVTLEPGQVLYVPRRWWHLVECLENSISINSWIEMAEDDESRLEEAVARAIVTSLIKLHPESEFTETWLNPNEEFPTMGGCRTFLSQTWDLLRNSSKSSAKSCGMKNLVTSEDCSNAKRLKLDGEETKSDSCDGIDFDALKSKLYQSGTPVDSKSVEDLFELLDLPKSTVTECKSGSTELVSSDLTPNNFVNSVSHPEVVSLVCKLLKENLNFG